MQFGGALALSLLLVACGENQNSGLENRQAMEGSSTTSHAGQVYSAAGEVTAIAGDQVTIAHGPVEEIGWPAMTMTFRAASPETVQSVTVGDRVSFEFKKDAGAYVLTALSRAG